MTFSPTTAIVNNENCDLHYWYQGKGPLIVFIPGGNGHGRQFNPIIAALSDKYTCATFDRRQMSASQVKVSKRLSLPQQARDVRAVINVLGFDKAILFGSSGGGIISFQFALDFPDMVEHIIAHEAPTWPLLPDATEAYEFIYRCQELYEAEGVDAAAALFQTKLYGYDDEGVPKPMKPEPENPKNFWAHESLAFTMYVPNLLRIKENGTSIGVMRAVRSRDAWYARATNEQAKLLDCPHFDVPGHHEGFQVELEAFLPYFFNMLDALEKKCSERSQR
ncbi:alpha/beta hydrolase fold-containing protein (acetyltransferase/esterase) [Colletotrichum truncatum]|uniref:Alpha/beta hydrolase fold-containing protein (Acetyltransferase/esterase) n=1 Tax=Colletotrichum truncatum TaxID=5467 RepID=A0ACC3Z2Z4_COLTU|nr:alpha/beta hydrolase fold-containing protein (acetyltransferase/esterase) [Colletotrichum truncatum]KAF6793215.1 alpha/beta hydrolase fold-containing protein (acetyltransferase/esterase) [Colletotrichum truncatum]